MKSERERQIPYEIIYMWNLKKKNDTNEPIYKTEIDSDVENMQLTKGKGGESPNMLGKCGLPRRR